MKASELMTPDPACITPGDSVQAAARLMGSYNVGSLPVVEGGDNKRLVGIITDRDVAIGAVAEGRMDATVADVMTPNPRTVHEEDDASRVEEIMAEEQVRRVPVVNERGAVVGMIAQADLALAENGISDRTVGRVVEKISEPEGSGPGSSRA
ncbi:MAG TPA: CBS domain-containing protein [Gemmatimonadales bacterium]|nr:CBS domain-containing protein [Gemmatimonadales bacterium]